MVQSQFQPQTLYWGALLSSSWWQNQTFGIWRHQVLISAKFYTLHGPQESSWSYHPLTWVLLSFHFELAIMSRGKQCWRLPFWTRWSVWGWTSLFRYAVISKTTLGRSLRSRAVLLHKPFFFGTKLVENIVIFLSWISLFFFTRKFFKFKKLKFKWRCVHNWSTYIIKWLCLEI